MGKGNAIVVGAGIAGLAMARALAVNGYKVTVIERNHTAVGASIRNFGMVWPIGQPSGELYQAAKRSAEIWKESCSGAGIFSDPVGSLHLAYHQDEAQVLEELYEIYKNERPVELLTPSQVLAKSDAVNGAGLRSGFFSGDEVIVDPRQAISSFPAYFSERYGIEFIWNKAVIGVEEGVVHTADNKYSADLVIVCSGVEFETMFPEIFAARAAVKCKLQMLRYAAQPDNWRIGPALCGGLSLIHYHSFKAASSLATLKKRYEEEMPEYLQWGIHVMVSQNGKGELTIGDSHEYGGTHDPFDKQFINELILKYLGQFAQFRKNELIETWNGVYAKLSDGAPYFFISPVKGVHLFNGLGGAGMTLSFGLAEKLVKSF
ncbi:MAG TPA: TIGR03364 family FAD-dependent oxidoreductase [Chitinophagaceae bacterium]|nr:TIGR03364 family FAD-dependent oxidoreductase [Chitinophagaceae bacterium]